MKLEIKRWIPVGALCHSVLISSDGQYIVVGHEYGVQIYNLDGEILLDYPENRVEFPVIQLSARPDFSSLFLLSRTGQLVRLDISKDGNRFRGQASVLYQSRNPDLKSLAIAADGSKVALGHFNGGLAVVEMNGESKRKHPDDGTATVGANWSVAMNDDGSILYAGSGTIASGLNSVACFDTAQSTLLEHTDKFKLPSRASVKTLQYLSSGSLVLVANIWNDEIGLPQDWVINLLPSLEKPIWALCFDETITAVGTETHWGIILLGSDYMGKIIALDRLTGRRIQYGEQIILNTMVNDLAASQDGMLVAVTEDQHLVLLGFSD